MDHRASCIRSGNPKFEEEGDSVNPCVLSISRVVENGEEGAHHVVECKFEGSSTVFRRSFFPTTSNDPEGKAAALRFALCTDSLPAFKSYLRGHRGNSDRASSRHQACFTVYTSVRRNTFCGVYFTAAILILLDGSSHSISFKNAQRSKGTVTCPVVQFIQSPAFKRWASKVSKATGEAHTSKCERCGGVGHRKWLSWSDQKDCEDYTCSICLMIQKQKIYTIRLEEQQSDGMQSLDGCQNEVRSTYMDFGCNACCVCGCDDNEDLDDLVPCPCNNSHAMVHSGCAATYKTSEVSMLGSESCCIMCGSGQANTKIEPTGSVDSRGQGTNLGMKRTWMHNGMNVAVAAYPQSQSRDATRVEIDSTALCTESRPSLSDKHGAKRLGWRFNGAPAVVPIKKRRIQMTEVSRSPSPKLKQLPSEPITGLGNSSRTKLTSESFDFPCSEPKLNSPSSPVVLDSSSTNLSATSHSSKSVSSSTSLCFSRGTPTQSPKSASSILEVLKKTSLPLEGSSESMSCIPTSDLEPQNVRNLILIPQPPELPTSIIKSPSIDSLVSNLSSFPKEFSLKSASSFSELHSSTGVTQAQLPTARHGIHTVICREVNRDMEEGFLGSVVPAAKSQPDNSQEVEDGELVISRDSNMEDVEATKESPEVTSQRMKSCRSLPRSNFDGFRDDRSCWDLNTEMESWNNTSATITKEKLSVNTSIINDKFDEDKCSTLSKYNRCFKYRSRRISETATRFFECSEHSVVEYESKDVGNEMLGNARTISMQAGAFFMSETKLMEESCEKHAPMSKVNREGGPLSTKVEIGNKLPGTFDANEHINCSISVSTDDEPVVEADNREFIQDKGNQETCNHVALGNKTISSRTEVEKNHDGNYESHLGSASVRATKRTGWDQLPEGFDSVEDGLRAARGTLSCEGYVEPRDGSSLSSPASSFHVFGRCRFGSGRDLSRDGRCHNLYGDRHVEEPSRRRDSFGHTRQSDGNAEDYHRGRSSKNETTGYSSRGRSNEWDDGQTGSKTQWNQGRDRRSGFTSSPNRSVSAVARERSLSASDNAAARDGAGCSGLRFTLGGRGGERGHHFSVSQISPSEGSNSTNRVDRVMNLENRGFDPYSGSGHGSVGRYRAAHSGRGSEFKSESPPKFQSSDNLNSNRGHRPESGDTRPRLSPENPDSFVHSKSYPMTSRRSKLSPRTYKWSSNRREAGGFRERDHKRSMRRSYGPSGRTSPHVVHGSSLMDERDWQVLAGTCRSPCVREDSNPSGYLRSFGDDCSDVRQVKQNEDGVLIQSKDEDHETSLRNSERERDVWGSAHRRDRDEGKRRDSYRVSSTERSEASEMSRKR